MIPALRDICTLTLNRYWINDFRMVLSFLGKAKQILFKFNGLFMLHQINDKILFSVEEIELFPRNTQLEQTDVVCFII